MNDRIFSHNLKPNHHIVSKVKVDREYLLNEKTGNDLNVYKNFGYFYAFNDIYDKKFSTNGQSELVDGVKIGIPAARSIFNPAGTVALGANTAGRSIKGKNINIQEASEWRISNNVPLMDSAENRRRIRMVSGCSVKELVDASRAGLMGRAIYSYADFMYCKYLGQMPNNYLITLRRFPIPPGDYISAIGEGKTRKNGKAGGNNGGQQIGCMVTWLGTPGNDINNILKYNYKMPFQEKQAKWEQVSHGDADEGNRIFNSLAAATDPAYMKNYQLGMGGSALNSYVGKMFGLGNDNGPYDAKEYLNWRDDNKVYGPINRVKSIKIPGENGLEFKQSITITFEYELRSYNGINTRQAALDLLSTILAVTYSTGDFWGGGYRGGGMHQNSIFNNLKIFKTTGGFNNFIDAFNQDVNTLGQAAKEKWNLNFDASKDDSLWKTGVRLIKSFMNNIGGMLMGGLLNKFGRPVKAYANSLLSDRPVGLWHLMVGNPHHPIISIGNMVIDNCTIEHGGLLGLDDFPTELKVTVELSPGKPRDSREIERMYMHGNDRIYTPMGPKLWDMYNAAKAYKDKSEKTPEKETEKKITEGRNAVKKKLDEIKPATSKNQEKTNVSVGDGDKIPPKKQETKKLKAVMFANDKNPDDGKKPGDGGKPDDGKKPGDDKKPPKGDDKTKIKNSESNKTAIKEQEKQKPQNTLNSDILKEIHIAGIKSDLNKWFGETDTYSILFQSCEQEYGSTEHVEPTRRPDPPVQENNISSAGGAGGAGGGAPYVPDNKSLNIMLCPAEGNCALIGQTSGDKVKFSVPCIYNGSGSETRICITANIATDKSSIKRFPNNDGTFIHRAIKMTTYQLATESKDKDLYVAVSYYVRVNGKWSGTEYVAQYKASSKTFETIPASSVPWLTKYGKTGISHAEIKSVLSRS